MFNIVIRIIPSLSLVMGFIWLLVKVGMMPSDCLALFIIIVDRRKRVTYVSIKDQNKLEQYPLQKIWPWGIGEMREA